MRVIDQTGMVNYPFDSMILSVRETVDGEGVISGRLVEGMVDYVVATYETVEQAMFAMKLLNLQYNIGSITAFEFPSQEAIKRKMFQA